MKKVIRNLALLLVTLGGSNLSAQIVFTRLDPGIDPNIGLYGIAWCDYNNDGWMDFYHPGNQEDSRLYKSVGGTFINMSPPDNDVFLDLTGVFSTGAVWGDFDNDGDPDIFACDLSLKIYRSENFGVSWTEISESAGLDVIDADLPIWMVTAADYDGDGDLDVAEAGSDQGITGVASPIRILKNNDMVFTDEAPTLIGFDINLESWNPMWVDVDNDGDSDLFMPTIRTPSQSCVLLINNAGVSFDVANNNNTGLECASAITSSWADYNNDGYMDLFAVPYGGGVAQLYKNNGNLTFTDMAPTYGLNLEYADTRTCHWADYDNDGDNDLIVSQRTDLIHFWRNDGNGFTRDNDTEASLSNAGENKRMIQFVDYDNDGFLDLWVGNYNGPKYLMHNGGNSNHWLGIIPKGITNNKTGVGVRIRVVTGTRSQVRDIQAGGGGMSGGYTRGHFGLAGATMVDSLIVRWPNGMVDVVINVAADKYYIFTEGGTMAELQPAVIHQTDVGISRIVVPSKVGINKSVTISAEITNYGRDSQGNFPVSYQLDSGSWVTETFNQTLVIGRTATYEFSTKWAPSTLGWHSITVKTGLNGDQNTDNDSQAKNVQVVDAAYIGTWRGTTSQNLPIYFHVNAEDNIDSTSAEIRVDFGSASGIFLFANSNLIPIVNDTFSVEIFGLIGIPAGTNYPIVQGTFRDTEFCDGTISQFIAASGFVGGVFIIGTGCTNPSKTWSANRYYENIFVEEVTQHPENALLRQNYPNPFNPNTTIEYSLTQKAFVSLKVFDILGKEILTLVECQQPAGNYRIQFINHHLPSGVYIYRLETDNFIQIKRMIISK